jgi:hypothetical protein
MSIARIFKVENKLAKLARAPGGKTVEEAVKAAETRVESVRLRCLASLVEKSNQLAVIASGDRGEGARQTLDKLYNLSNAIFGVAGAFGLKALAEAACSLCDVVHRFRGGETLNWSAVDVHVDGIRLLSMGSPEGADSILAGLRRVRARFAAD